MDWKLTRVQHRHYRLLFDHGLWLADVRWAPDGKWVVWYDARDNRWQQYTEHATLKAARVWIGQHFPALANGMMAEDVERRLLGDVG